MAILFFRCNFPEVWLKYLIFMVLLACFLTIHNKSNPPVILIQQRKLLIFLRKTCMFLPVVFTCFSAATKAFAIILKTKKRRNPAPFLDGLLKNSYFYGLRMSFCLLNPDSFATRIKMTFALSFLVLRIFSFL